MNGSASTPLRIGDWRVDPLAGTLTRDDDCVRVEARAMRLLLALAERPGETVAIDDLLDQAWAGVIVTPDSVYQAIAGLRRQLGDDPRNPSYIATVPRLGYRLVAKVEPWRDEALPPASDEQVRRHLPIRAMAWAGAASLALIAVFSLVAWTSPPGPVSAPVATRVSVGVAPFVDLTPSMDQDVLADEMTEAVADRLSRNAALKSPGFRASYYLIGKHATAAQAAKTLGVVYLVDGGVRRTGDAVRVSARLVRADTGLVVWSQAYNGRMHHLAPVQDALAAAVATALAKVDGET